MRFFLTALVCLFLSVPALAAGNTTLNVGLNIPKNYEKVYPGGELVVELAIMNLAAEKRVDVVVDYSVKSQDGAAVSSEKETLAVETKASFVKTLRIPPEAKPGKYVVSAFVREVIESDRHATASASFEIAEKPKDLASTAVSQLQKHVLWIVSAVLALVLLFLVYRSRRRIGGFFLKNKVHSIVRERLGR